MRPRIESSCIFSALVVAGLFLAKPSSTYDIPLPGPAPREHGLTVAGIGRPTDERCADCHVEIAAEWRQSLHRAAWENEYFLHAYALEPLAFCRGCHAPEAHPSQEPSVEARHVGVGCTSCHVVSAGIVGTHGMAATQSGHEVIGDARMATAAACGRCHDFAFPATRRPEDDRMQKTMSEHAASVYSAKPCQECHMPLVPSQKGPAHRKHDFRVFGDREFMRRAVVVEGAKIQNDGLHLDLNLGTIGHAFPTGDLYRRVEVRATPVDSQGKTIGSPSVEVLNRIFGPAYAGPDQPIPREREDRRLTGPKQFILPLPGGTKRARYEIVWQRLPPVMAQKFRMKMSEHEMVVGEGIVIR